MGQVGCVVCGILDATAVQCQLVGAYGDPVVVQVALCHCVAEDHRASRDAFVLCCITRAITDVQFKLGRAGNANALAERHGHLDTVADAVNAVIIEVGVVVTSVAGDGKRRDGWSRVIGLSRNRGWAIELEQPNQCSNHSGHQRQDDKRSEHCRSQVHLISPLLEKLRMLSLSTWHPGSTFEKPSSEDRELTEMRTQRPSAVAAPVSTPSIGLSNAN